MLHRPNVFETTYNSMAVNEKLDLLEIIYDELWQSTSQTLPMLTNDATEFLALTFCKKSDLILKTVDTFVNSIDPTEVILILNILGPLTLMPYKISKNARPLIINCKCKCVIVPPIYFNQILKQCNTAAVHLQIS